MPDNLTTKCRVSGSEHLISVVNLGIQELTGVFPKSVDEKVTAGPLEVVWCPDSGLLQLAHSFDAGEMYGDNYGYRSGLNGSMVRHLNQKVRELERFVALKAGDAVLDIGSNDATTLKSYQTKDLLRIGIDPTGGKFRSYYGDEIKLVADFFSSDSYLSVTKKRAKIITSIAMFYDLDDPVGFAKQIHEVLDDQGVWHLEQSYMPTMLRMCSYDTICHEHVEYYSLGVIKNILERADMKIIDVKMNGINGGSFAVTAAKRSTTLKPNQVVINWMLGQEDRMGLNTPKPYRDFEERVFRHRADLQRLIRDLVDDGKTVAGYGASTKGNVLLQFCGLTSKEIPYIAEVNPDKFGSYTPGSRIPIISEEEAKRKNPDYFLVLPWHFKDSIMQREQEYLSKGGKFIFPLPEIEIV